MSGISKGVSTFRRVLPVYVAVFCVVSILSALAVDGHAWFIDSGDKIASITACVVTLLGLYLIYKQLALQAYGNDITSILTIADQLTATTYSLNFEVILPNGQVDQAKWLHHFRTLMQLYETACFYLNEEMLQEKARYLLSGHIRHGLRFIYSDPNLVAWVNHMKQETPNAFAEIDKFLSRPRAA